VFEFLSRMTKHHFKTAQAVAALEDAGVLIDWPISTKRGGSASVLLRVDDAAMSQVAGDQLAQLQRIGALSIAYAQMLSTHQLPRLQALAYASAEGRLCWVFEWA